MPPFTTNWVDEIEDDFYSPEEFVRIEKKMQIVSLNPYSQSKALKGASFLRTVRIGAFRLFIMIKEETSEIYCLAYLPRKTCYSKKSLNRVLARVKNAF